MLMIFVAVADHLDRQRTPNPWHRFPQIASMKVRIRA